MEKEHLEQVKELINRIADSYDVPSDKQTAEMRKLTNENWQAEDLQELCCEYWSHHSFPSFRKQSELGYVSYNTTDKRYYCIEEIAISKFFTTN